MNHRRLFWDFNHYIWNLYIFFSYRRISKNTKCSVLNAPCNEHFVLTLDDLMMNFTWAISITVAIWSSSGFEMKAFAVDRRNFECLIWIICHNLIGAFSLCCEKMRWNILKKRKTLRSIPHPTYPCKTKKILTLYQPIYHIEKQWFTAWSFIVQETFKILNI